MVQQQRERRLEKIFPKKGVRAIPLEGDLPASEPAYFWWHWHGGFGHVGRETVYLETYLRFPLHINSIAMLLFDSITNKGFWKLIKELHTTHSFKYMPNPSHIALHPPALYAQSDFFLKDIVKLPPGQTQVYSHGLTHAWNKSTAHLYAMPTTDTLYASQHTYPVVVEVWSSTWRHGRCAEFLFACVGWRC